MCTFFYNIQSDAGADHMWYSLDLEPANRVMEWVHAYAYTWAKDHREKNIKINLDPTKPNSTIHHCKQIAKSSDTQGRL